MILVASKSRKNASALSDMLYHMGILSAVCTDLDEKINNLTYFKAIIFLDPDTISNKGETFLQIRKAKPDILTAAVGCIDEDAKYFDLVLDKSTYASKIYEAICKEANKRAVTPPGKYRLGDFYADAERARSGYKKETLPFSKTENMILRTLICAYPTPLSAEELLYYSFRNSRLPEISNVRTHICIMNKKFRLITSTPLAELITSRGSVLAKENIFRLC